MQKFENIAVVITGGASGLGAATARAIAAKGAKVAIFDIDPDKGQALADNIGGTFCRVDITDDAAVEAGFHDARAAQGQERILINCAGRGNAIKTASRARDTGAIASFPMDAFERIVQINLIGTFRCIARSAAGMLTLDPLEDGERGVIVNTGSIAAEDGQAGQAAYAASKSGIAGLTLPVARDLMNEGIRVNTILPGVFDTPLLATAPPHVRDGIVAKIPFPRRLGHVDEFARLTLEICSNTYLNAAIIRLDGGVRMTAR